jgi:hypothetical protein
MTALACLIHPDSAPAPVVARTPAHEQAEQLLARLRGRRKAMNEKLDLFIGWSDAKQQASAELAKLNDEIREVRTSLIPHRNRHLANARKAFRGPRRNAARRALAALKEAEDAMLELDVMSAELRRLGGADRDLQAAKILYCLVAPLERLAREKGEPS